MSTTNYDQSEPGGDRHHIADTHRTRDNDESFHRMDHESDADLFSFARCALIAQPSEWTRELEQLGARRFKRPESLYSALRSRSLVPELCIVDLDSVPRNLVKAVDIRIPCPKLWMGKTAANPDDIKNFGIYYSKARPDELTAVMSRLIAVDRSMILPASIAGKRILPLLVADEAYRDCLQRYVELFSHANLISLHGDDALELQLIAYYLAVECQRPRIWEVKSESSIPSTLRKIAQARRPGSDVSIVFSRNIDTETAREFYKSMPAEYAMIKLSARADDPIGSPSLSIPRPADRPLDIETWIVWFICRSTIDQGIALSGLYDLVRRIRGMLGDDPTIDETEMACEQAIKQHATFKDDQDDYMSYEDMVHNYERTLLRRALGRHDWNLSATAKSLGLPESSLRYKLNKLGIMKNDPQA